RDNELMEQMRLERAANGHHGVHATSTQLASDLLQNAVRSGGVELATRARRCRHANESDLPLACKGRIGNGAQAPRGARSRHALREAGLDHGAQATLNHIDLSPVNVDADHSTALFGQQGSCDATDITQPEYADVDSALSLCCDQFAQCFQADAEGL